MPKCSGSRQKKKALGVFSAEGKAYRESEEYQATLPNAREYNSRLAALEERDSALTEQMKAANERLQQRKDAQAWDAQRAYDAKAKEYSGNAEYRRVLAKEQFGVTGRVPAGRVHSAGRPDAGFCPE